MNIGSPYFIFFYIFSNMLQVLSHLLYLMRVGEKVVQRRVALALAHLCAPDDQRTIFIDNIGKTFSSS